MSTLSSSRKVLIAKLEELWQRGEQPDPFVFLEKTGVCAADLVASVLAIDQWQRWHLGQRVSAEDYLQRCPVLQSDENAGLEVIYGEFMVRHALGEKPDPGEYLQRFPHFAAGLREHFTLFEALEASGLGTSIEAKSESLSDQTQEHSQTANRKSPSETRVPGYEILGELGRGGMGVVYKARDVKLNRIIAIKMVLAGSDANSEQLMRFLTEAQAAAQVQHPHIVPIFEIGRHNDLPYFTQEYLSGGSLAHERNGAPLSPGPAARLVEQLALGVHAAHQHGIIHRDLKPANVLLTEDGTPKIADFGLAKHVQAGDGLTMTGTILGTPSYMAPEQADGKSQKVGPACDIYALGAILYELLTGRPPFKAASVLETLQQVCKEEPIPPRQFQSKTPQDLETICLKCLQKEPGKRYPTAQALAEDLARFQAGEPVLARPVGRLERTWRWCRRNPVVAALTTATTLLLLLLAIGSTIAAYTLEGALTESEVERSKAQTAEKAVARERDDALKNLAQAYLEQARSKRLSGRMGQRFDSLDAIKKALALTGPTLELRNAALACLVLPDARVTAKTEITRAFISPDLKHCVCWHNNDNESKLALLHDMSDNRLLAKLAVPGKSDAYRGSDFSPDSQLFGVACANGQFRVWRLGAGEPTLVLNRSDGHCMTFSADNRHVAIWDQQTKICRILDLENQRKAVKIAAEEGWNDGFHGMAFHPRLPRLALVEPSRTRIVDIHTGRVVLSAWTTPGSDSIEHVAWHPEGRLLAIARKDHCIHLADPDTGREAVPPLHGFLANGLRLSFSHGGDILASTSWEAELQLWDSWTGRQLFQAPLGLNTGFCFSKDDRLLAAAQVGLIELAFGRELRVFNRPVRLARDDQAGYGGPRVTKDGLLLAAATETGLALIELCSGRELAHEKLSHAEPMLFDSTGALWLNRGTGGLDRWPVRITSQQTVTYGPPQQVTPAQAGDLVGFGKDGQVLAFPNFHSADVLHRGQNPFTVRLNNLSDCRLCAVSPDGSWVVAANHWGEGITVYESRTGKLVKQGRHLGGRPGFSPDGRWLAVRFGSNNKDMHFLEVGTWKEWPVLDSSSTAVLMGAQVGFVFAPDSRSIAVSTGYGTVRVLRVPTGEELYRLEIPEQTLLSPQCFTADGAQLIAVGRSKLYVWDLLTLRQQLRELSLDWDEPSYPKAAKAAAVPLKAELILDAETYFSQGNDLLAQERLDDAVAAYQKAVSVAPQHDAAQHHLGIVQKARHAKQRFAGRHLEGTLTQTEKQKIHELKMTAGMIYIIDLESSAFDAFLKLQDAQGKLLVENDDIVPGVNLNARIVFAPRADATFRVVATSFREAGSGAYTLRIRELGPAKKI